MYAPPHPTPHTHTVGPLVFPDPPWSRPCPGLLLQEIMSKIGKPQALGSLDENMGDDEEDDEGAEDDGIEIEDAAGDDLAAAMGKAHI